MFAWMIGAGLVAATLALSSPVQSEEAMTDKARHGVETVAAGSLSVSAYWTRAMLPGQKVGGGYLVISNQGAQDDRLLAASSGLTDRVEIHEMVMENDVMRMRPLSDGLPVPAGETVTLKPGGFHLMFMNVDTPLAEGDQVEVTLTFEKAGSVMLKMPVLPASTGRGGHQGDHSPGHDM